MLTICVIINPICSRREQIDCFYYSFFFFLSITLLSINIIPVLFFHCLFHQPARGFGDCSGSHRTSPCTPRQEASSFCSVTQSTLECTASLKDISFVILKLHQVAFANYQVNAIPDVTVSRNNDGPARLSLKIEEEG